MIEPARADAGAALGVEERVRLQRPGAFQPLARRAVVEIEQQHRHAGVGDVRGNLRAHRPGAKDGDRIDSAIRGHVVSLPDASPKGSGVRPLLLPTNEARHVEPLRGQQASARDRHCERRGVSDRPHEQSGDSHQKSRLYENRCEKSRSSPAASRRKRRSPQEPAHVPRRRVHRRPGVEDERRCVPVADTLALGGRAVLACIRHAHFGVITSAPGAWTTALSTQSAASARPSRCPGMSRHASGSSSNGRMGTR